MRPCFAPTAGRTFYKTLRHTVIVRKDSFEYVIKMEKGSYFSTSLIPLENGRMLMLAFWGDVLEYVQEADIEKHLDEGMKIWRNIDQDLLGISQTVDCGMPSLEAVYSNKVRDAAYALCRVCVRLYNHCLNQFSETELMVLGETFA